MMSCILPGIFLLDKFYHFDYLKFLSCYFRGKRPSAHTLFHYSYARVTAHSFSQPVPQTWQLWSFIYWNCISFSQKSDYCTHVVWKASLSHIVSLELKTEHFPESTSWMKKQHPAGWQEAALHSSAPATMAAAGETRTALIPVCMAAGYYRSL